MREAKVAPKFLYTFHCRKCGFSVADENKEVVQQAKKKHQDPWRNPNPLAGRHKQVTNNIHSPCPMHLAKTRDDGARIMIRQDLAERCGVIA